MKHNFYNDITQREIRGEKHKQLPYFKSDNLAHFLLLTSIESTNVRRKGTDSMLLKYSFLSVGFF